MEELLKSKGYTLNDYLEGKFWELTVENDEVLKARICRHLKLILNCLLMEQI